MTNNKKILFLLRGIPGCGKTTLATDIENFLGCYSVAADDFFYDKNGNYKFNAEYLNQAHRWCQNQTEEAMIRGEHIVVHNTLTTEKEMKPYLLLAHKYNYEIKSLIVENRHGGNNEHGVPNHALVRMKNRFSIKL